MKAPEATKIPRKLKDSQTRIALFDGRELQYYLPFRRDDAQPIDLRTLIPAEWASKPLEVEIGPGKGEFLARRAAAHPETYFVGIDRRIDRTELTTRKLERSATTEDGGRNWHILREDARSFLDGGLPPIQILHLYHPDPWPKTRHHKHRFFRSPDARRWAEAIARGGEFRISTDHREYFEEILDIVYTWKFLRMGTIFQKTASAGPPSSHFEGIFFRRGEPVYKAIFFRD